MDLRPAMHLGGRSLLKWLNPDHDYLPTGGWLESHDTGRWWDAMLRLEHATGFVIPAEMEAAMLRNLHMLTDNPDGLLFIPPGLSFRAPRFELHSIREGLLAFSALVRYRGSTWAAQRGRRMLETIHRCLRADGTWNLDCFEYPRYADAKIDLSDPSILGDMTGSTGRCIEGLVEFYDAAGDSLALELADVMARHHLERSTMPDGSMPPHIVDPDNAGHSHSYLGTLRGLLRFGRLTRQHEYVDAVAAAYQRSVREHVITESGFTPHDLGKTRYPDEHGDPVGETASAGDVAQLALWLGIREGESDLLDDAERVLRSRLLPGQTTKQDAVANPDVPDKNIGGWGAHREPHGSKGVILDVTASVVHTLVDLYVHAVERTADGLFVNLHFDHAGAYCEASGCGHPGYLDFYSDSSLQKSPRYHDVPVSMTSTRDEEAKVCVTPGDCVNVFVRIPDWTDPKSVRASIDDAPVEPKLIGSYLFVPAAQVEAGRCIVVQHSLPRRETSETTSHGQSFGFDWRGDEIVGIQPNAEKLPFYPG